ncbi:hypothetical protein [Botryobacter ruber]|uniref:hypothetical protein n=1 Tax=Botryobacter ruber TaxID=2171629 RepID=UPI000E09EB8E|nr:hypothetical protein [Botryobacter ruber]
MKKIEITVNDADFLIVKSLLENLRYIKSFEEKEPVDEVTLLSQKSLAEDWDSEEDDRYDQLYNAEAGEATKK